MRFTSYLLNLRRPFPYRYWVNRSLTALPGSSPRIQFLFVRLTLCYRLPSSVRYLPDSVESLVLPSIGRTVDFHHQTHVRCWAHRKKPPKAEGLRRLSLTLMLLTGGYIRKSISIRKNVGKRMATDQSM